MTSQTPEKKCCDKYYSTYTTGDWPNKQTLDACINQGCKCHTPEETQDTEVEEMVAQLLLRTYDRCFVRGQVPPEVGSSIAHYDLFLKEELTNLLHHQLQKARQEGYGLAVKHLKEAYSANGATTVPEAIEWLEDNARLYHSELDQLNK